MHVGFVGLGNMGGPMADWLLKAGLPLVVHDIRTDAAAPLLEQGATWADSAAALASQCDVVCLCLPGPPEMQAVTLGPRGLLAGLRPGAICIDHTTNSPEVVRQVGAVLKERQVHLLDAPLDGGREGALEGQLTLFVGGEEAILQRVRPVLDAFARSVVWVGDLGAGSDPQGPGLEGGRAVSGDDGHVIHLGVVDRGVLAGRGSPWRRDGGRRSGQRRPQ